MPIKKEEKQKLDKRSSKKSSSNSSNKSGMLKPLQKDQPENLNINEKVMQLQDKFVEASKIIQELKEKNMLSLSSDLISNEHSHFEKEELLRNRRASSQRIKLIETKLLQSQEKVTLLSQEVIKRNTKLQQLAEAYTKLKQVYDEDKGELLRTQKELTIKEKHAVSLITTLERYKRQLLKSNTDLEALYKKLVNFEQRERESQAMMKKLRVEIDKLMAKNKEKDLEIIKNEERSRNTFLADRDKLRKDYENTLAQAWEKEKFLMRKIAHMNQQIMQRDRLISEKDKKLSFFTELHRKLRSFIGEEIVKKEQVPVKKKLSFFGKPKPMRPIKKQELETLIPHPELKEKEEMEIAEEIQETPIKETKELHLSPPEALPTTAEEIIPMIDIALQHGDSPDTIRHSLLSAGYAESEVEKALTKVKK